jgi:peptidoglycan/xylan/chitin deacetylase (PgdA/CDA1 family)
MSVRRMMAVRRSFHAVGGLHAVRYLNRKRARILMFHRFGASAETVASFRRHCRYIAENYCAMSLSDLVAALRGERAMPDNATVITVDDGYRDFYDVAYPILRDHGLPAIVYLVSDFLDARSWLWVDEVRYCVRHTAARNFEFQDASDNISKFNWESDSERNTAASAINQLGKTLPNSARLSLLQRVHALLGHPLPQQPPAEYAPMTWDMVREMSRNRIEFGVHTQTHPIMPNLETVSDAEREVVTCKGRMEAELNIPAVHFCYPNGDFDERTVDVVRRAGFRSAVTVQCGLNTKGGDLFLLKRIGVEPYWPDVNFRHFSAGSILEAVQAK